MKTPAQPIDRVRSLMAALLIALFVPLCAVAQDETGITYTVLRDCSDTGYDDNQTPNFLFDGSTSTKWHMNRFKGGGNRRVITFQTSVPVNVCGYRISTGDDEESINLARNPKTWKLYGRNDQPTSKESTEGWTLISTVENDEQLTGEKFMTATYSCPTSDKYQYFRWEITAVRDPKNDCVQASEFSLVQATPFVEWNKTAKALTFKFGNKPEAGQPADENCQYYEINQQTVDYPAWREALQGGVTKAFFDNSFKYFQPTTCRAWFRDGVCLTSIEGMENLNTDAVTDMGRMFYYCAQLKSIDLTHFNTAQVKSMQAMFHFCESLTTLDVSRFSTANVTDMSQMFYNCKQLTTLDVSQFNTAQVTDMSHMFAFCENLRTLDLSEFTTANVTNMTEMFSNCSQLQTIYVAYTFTTEKCKNDNNNMFALCKNLKGAVAYVSGNTGTSLANYIDGYFMDIAYARWSDDGKTLTFYSNHDRKESDCGLLHGMLHGDEIEAPSWFGTSEDDVARVENCTKVVFDESFQKARPTNCAYWFLFFKSLENIEGIEHLNTSEVTTMESMFYGCGIKTALDLSALNTSKVQNMANMFEQATISSLNLSGLDCSAVTNMEAMFNVATVPSLNLSGLRTSNLEEMGSMFESLTTEGELDLSGFRTEHVTDMNSLFSGCTAKAIRLSNDFNTSNVTDMGRMFKQCKNISTLDLSLFNTAKVTNMREMFRSCSALKELNLSSFNTENVTDMASMFYECSSLTSLDLSKFSTDKVEEIYEMFGYCSSLTQLDLKHFNTQKVGSLESMFEGCSALESLDISGFNTAEVRYMPSMFKDCKSLQTLNVSSLNTENVLNMASMFSGCSTLKELDLMNFNTANVQTLKNMFDGCSSLVWIFADSKFSTAACTSGNDMFKGCTSLLGAINFDPAKIDHTYANNTTGYFADKSKGRSTYVRFKDGTLTFYYSYFKQDGDYELNSGQDDPVWMRKKSSITKAVFDRSFKDQSPWTCRRWFYKTNLCTIEGIENLDVSGTRNIASMFQECKNLTVLDLSTFNTANLNIMNNTFYGCSSLTTIYVSDKFTQPKQKGNLVFEGCNQLVGAIPYGSGSDKTFANYETGYFTKKVGTNGTDIIGAVGKPLTIAELHLDDNKAFDLYEDCNITTVSYVRQMKTKWGTLCLPFTIDAVSENMPCSFYTLTEVGDESVTLEKVESGQIAAGQPVLIRRTDESEEKAYISNAQNAQIVARPTGTESGNLLVGTFATKQLSDDCYFLANDEFRLVEDYKQVAKGVKVAAFHAYLQPKEQVGGQSASVLSIGVRDETTAMEAAEVVEQLNNEATEYYDMNGRRIPNLRKGVNIVKTGNKVRKVIIK